ncbi:hypothetical protein LSH36_72g00001 [Paralvinella palmiformis]|uniref:EF-hand domain-containing protein n=1 Tax=Paralvinella palmiformis TaxID=53620 RepID=A0AAD9K2T2_9ANNE|nr:hypothetical protein LSH36_72g00001 [Paralvinella palmiformis]
MAFFDHHKSPRFNAIQAQELMHILNQTPTIKAYYGITWSLELCKIMIAMLDRSKDGMMQYPEFRELLQCLNFWYQVFIQYDTNRTGYMEANELGRCIQQRLRMYRSRFCKTEEFSKLTHFAKNIIILKGMLSSSRLSCASEITLKALELFNLG